MVYTTGSHLEHLNQPKRELNLRISVKKCFSNNDRQPRMQIFIFILHNEDTSKITVICAVHGQAAFLHFFTSTEGLA